MKPRSALVFACASLGLVTAARPAAAQGNTQPGPGGGTTAQYGSLDRIEDDWVNRNPIPTRPMALMPDGTTVWAVNPYLSQVVKIQAGAVVPNATIRTLPGPVAIASYEHSGGRRLLVVCQHSNAVAVHEEATGNMVAVLPVRAQPADVVVDGANHAWVSCPSEDVVVEIDLTTASFTQKQYPVPARFPTFLSLVPGTPGEVLVAPRISGNGSLVDRKAVTANNAATLHFNEHAGPRGILDTHKVEVIDESVEGAGLPDEDLFWLDRTPGVARAIARETGTLLFAHAVRPTTTTVWQLNLEANNKAPNLQSEGSLAENGVVFNRLTQVVLPTLNEPVTPVTGHTVVNLNDPLPATANSMGTPYSLAFNSTGTTCYVAGLLTDNVVVLDANGARTGTVYALPAGTMPRQVLLDAAQTTLFVWGMVDRDGSATTWGDSNCAVHAIPISTGVPSAIDIGFDPTPPVFQAGRATFFDASHSRNNDASCASCHDEGRTDMLAWNLSHVATLGPGVEDDDGLDEKGPMVTQTLTGIRTAAPFHWRGEQQRGLIDFNGAFEGLLGEIGTPQDPPGLDPTPGGEFDRFEAFVLSLTEDPNPIQHKNRILDDSIDPPKPDGTPLVSSAVLGQQAFTDEGCIGCHTLPKGTSNEVVNNTFSGEKYAKLLWLDVASYQGIHFKAFQRGDPVVFDTDTSLHRDEDLAQDYPRVGTGLGHAGVVLDLVDFVLAMVQEEAGTTDDEARANIAAFLHQFDTGLAPATEAHKLIHSGNYTTLPSAIAYLLTQASASKRNCDVAVVGRTAPGAPVAGWAYDRVAGVFRSESGGTPLSTADFKTMAQAGGWFAFVGVPVGTARRFAIDFDGDQVPNGLETGSMFDPDSNDDGIWDGAGQFGGAPATIPAYTVEDPLEFQWETTRVARLTFETNELTTVLLTLQASGLPPVVIRESLPKLQHNLVVDELLPYRLYDVSLVISDLPTSSLDTPDETTVPVADLQSMPGQNNAVHADSRVVDQLAWSASTPVVEADGVVYTATGRVVLRASEPAVPTAGDFVVARVLIGVDEEPAASTDYVSGAFDNPFIVRNAFDTTIAPPLVISAPTGVDGVFTLQFKLTTAAAAQPIVLSIEAVGPLIPFPGSTHPLGWTPIPLPPAPLAFHTPNMDGRQVDPRFWASASLPEWVPSFWSFPDTRNEDDPADGNRKLEWP